MRNNKTMLRYSRNSALLFAAASGLLYMSSCSSEVDYPKGNVTESSVTVGNNPASQASRVTFFGNPGTRAYDAVNFPEVGEAPNIPADAPEFNTPNDAQQSQDQNKNTAYVLTGGEGQIELYGGDVFITGDVKTHNFNGSGGNVYVMPGAKLTLNGANNQNARIVVFGEIEVLGDITIGYNGQILVKESIHFPGRVAIEGTLIALESITIDGQLQINANAKVKGKCIEVNQENDKDAINMSAGGQLAVRSYLNCESLYLGNNAEVFLWPNAMADVTGQTSMTSNQAGFYYYSSEDKQKNALVRTGIFYIEGSADNPEYVGGLFNGILKLKYEELKNCQPAFTDHFIQSAKDYYIPKDGCNPGNGKPDDKPFDEIAIIDGPTHTHHHLSATCIQPVGNRAYVSYHLNEAYGDNAEEWAPISKHMGCVEVYDVTETQAQISSWLMNQDFDFNHLIVDGNKVYTTGDTEKYGATLGVITLGEDGNFGQYEMDTEGREDVMSYYNLYKKTAGSRGTSGNCIIRDGDSFRIASYAGFQSFNVNDLSNATDIITTPGSAKHIAKGDGYIVTLNLNDKGVDAVEGTVNVYTTWGNPIATFTTGKMITPLDGKNVIAVNGGYIYIALGERGVGKYSMTGELVANYSWIDDKLESNPEYKGRPLANGLCVDDKYVYVANGAVGTLVFDKDLNYITRYNRNKKGEETYSANYVQKVGDLIYIAYGRNGISIVKMRENIEDI